MHDEGRSGRGAAVGVESGKQLHDRLVVLERCVAELLERQPRHQRDRKCGIS